MCGIGTFPERRGMTMKPSEREADEREAGNGSPNSPETDEEPQQQEVTAENQNPNKLIFFVGQQLDVLDSVNYWTEAEVVKYDEENRKIFVSYLFWSSKWDEWVDISPEKVAPLHTHTYNPPNPLKLRQRIEVFGLAEWREAFVVDETDTQVKVHYRNVSYQHDEWIDRSSERIRRFGPFRSTKTKKWNIPTMSNSTTNIPMEANQHTRQITQLSDKYHNYILGLERLKLTVFSVSGDGNCLFRSVAHQIYGDDSYHLLVREKCMDYMEVNSSFFSQFVVGGMETFHLYLHAKRTNGCWGDDPEIQAMCEIYDRSAQIWAFDNSAGARCLRTFHEVPSRPTTAQSRPSSSSSSSSSSRAWWRLAPVAPKHPIRLSYYGGGHYDSIISTESSSRESPRVRSPGSIEEQAIARAKERIQVALSGQQHLEDIKQSSDVDATERAELELALEVSRNHLTQWEDDLDACLLLSNQEILKGDLSGSNEYKEIDISSGVIETQHQLLKSAVEQSEIEYLEKAIEDSIRSATNQDVDMDETEAVLLDTAFQASLSSQPVVPVDSQSLTSNQQSSIDESTKLALELSQLSEDEILQRVLNESLSHQRPHPFSSSISPPTSSLAASLREEEEMQEAIRMSMMNQSSSNRNQGNLYVNADLNDVDPDLELAIQESFRDLQR